MKTLEKIEISEIKQNNSSSYLMVVTPYERYGTTQEPIIYNGSGFQLIDKIKDAYNYDPEEYDSIEEFLLAVDSMNGDGYDYIQVFMN